MVILVALAVPAARAQPAPSPDVASAPLPGNESGQIVTDDGDRSTAGQSIARGVLFVPRVLVEGLLLPIRGGVWLDDRYELKDLYYRIFYNADRTFGIVPTIAYETGIGLTAGAHLIATDLFGKDEHLSISGTYGGSHSLRASGWLDSGHRFRRLWLLAGASIDDVPETQFYGIGNADLGPPPKMPVNPQTDDTAVETNYRSQVVLGLVAAKLRVLDELHLVARGSVMNLGYGPPASGQSLASVYAPGAVPGFDTGAEQLYGELELRWQHRAVEDRRFELLNHTTGWLVSGFAGRVHALDRGADFTHYGIDLQAYVHLSLAPRMLVFRLWGEGVTGAVDQVPFTELPQLGGDFLRGYPYGRFRDRVASYATAQYVWDLSRYVDAFLFVDAGRVYSSLDALTLHDLRVGYGGGLAVYTETGFVIEGSLASSIDGGIIVTATLSPIFDRRPRWP